MNNLAPVKNCPGEVQGNLNWMPGYEGGKEQSVSRITVWHHEACRVITNGNREGQIFLYHPTNIPNTNRTANG